MAYRQLTRDEIIQLGQELDDLRQWEGARDYVSALYGLDSTYSPHGHRPHQITISIVSEPQQNYRFRDAAIIIVTDAENNLIPYDFSRYWWSQFTLNKAAIEEFLRDTSGKLAHARLLGDEAILSALEALCTEKLGIEFMEYDRRHDPITYTYIIDTPPSISYTAVFVPE